MVSESDSPCIDPLFTVVFRFLRCVVNEDGLPRIDPHHSSLCVVNEGGLPGIDPLLAVVFGFEVPARLLPQCLLLRLLGGFGGGA